MTTLVEFYDQLENFDWYYEMSDDHKVWIKGNNELTRIKSIASQSEEKTKLFLVYNQHMFSGKTFGTVKIPKPPRPDLSEEKIDL